MKLRNAVEEITPEALQGLWAGLNPDRVYLEQPRMWAVWLLRGVLAVFVLLGLLCVAVSMTQ